MLTGDCEKIAKLSLRDFEDDRGRDADRHGRRDVPGRSEGVDRRGQDHRWKRLYTELTYQPMHEVLNYFRANGYKTFIVTGGGQDFVRVYSQRVYGIPPEQVVGTAVGTNTATTRTAGRS